MTYFSNYAVIFCICVKAHCRFHWFLFRVLHWFAFSRAVTCSGLLVHEPLYAIPDTRSGHPLLSARTVQASLTSFRAPPGETTSTRRFSELRPRLAGKSCRWNCGHVRAHHLCHYGRWDGCYCWYSLCSFMRHPCPRLFFSQVSVAGARVLHSLSALHEVRSAPVIVSRTTTRSLSRPFAVTCLSLLSA